MLLFDEPIIGMREAIRFSVSLLTYVASKPNAAALSSLFPSNFSPSDTVIYIDPTPVNPLMMIVYSDSRLYYLVASLGADRSEHFRFIGNGFIGPQPGSNATPLAYASPVALALSYIPENVKSDAYVAYFMGHSWGAAIAANVARVVDRDFPSTKKYVYSFGSPKEGLRHNAGQQWNGLYLRRVAITTDPVPNLPPGPEGWGATLTLLTVPNVVSALNYQHPTYALLLGSGVEPFTIGATSQQTRIVRDVVSIGEWATLQILGSASDHSLQNYASRIWEVVQAPDLQPDQRIRGPEPVPPIPTPGRINTIRQAERINNTSVTESNLPATATQVAQGTPRVPGLRFHATRRQGVRCVTYGSQIVAWTRTRRATVSLARQLNRTLKSEETLKL